ncbi:MAG: DUF2752 domain-containing protein [Microthrixaceae bacterium]
MALDTRPEPAPDLQAGAPGTDGGQAGAYVPPRRSFAAPITVGALATAGCVAVFAANPGDGGVPLCWSRSVFGVDCPFCGGLRATNSLLRLDLGAALDHNVVLAIGLPIAALLWCWSIVGRWRGAEPLASPPTWLMVTAGVLLVAFGVLRNFGGPAWIRWMHSDLYLG